MPLCPLFSKSAEKPSECLKKQCAWYLSKNKRCAVVEFVKEVGRWLS